MRVTIEESLFGERRLHKLSALMKWSLRETLGTLAFLWHESQNARGIIGHAGSIIDWSWIDDPEVGEAWVDALEAVGFISRQPDGQFEIHGNRQVLERVDEFRKVQGLRAAKGWETKRKKNAQGMPGASDGMPPEAGRCPEMPITVQFSTVQNSKTLTPNASPPPDGGQREKISYQPEDIAIADLWANWAKTVSVTVKVNREKWANSVRQMRELDKVPPEEILAMLDFVREDRFWSKNAISLPALRQRSDNGLLKHENIRHKMAGNGRPQEKPAPTGKQSPFVTSEADLDC